MAVAGILHSGGFLSAIVASSALTNLTTISATMAAKTVLFPPLLRSANAYFVLGVCP